MNKLRPGQGWQILTAIILWTVVILVYGPAALQKYNGEAQGATEHASNVVAPVPLTSPSDVSYVAVGDSYTIGTGTTPDHSWPAALTRELRHKGIKIENTGNLGVDGFTTQQAIDQELPLFESAKPTFATLMIGVNDTYNPTTPDQFHSELVQLLDRMQAVMPNKENLILVTIPDYSVTTNGAQFARMNNSTSKIIQFNDIIRSEGTKRGLPVVDVYPSSLQMGTDSRLRAGDNLHPSVKEYTRWEKLIYPTAYRMLR